MSQRTRTYLVSLLFYSFTFVFAWTQPVSGQAPGTSISQLLELALKSDSREVSGLLSQLKTFSKFEFTDSHRQQLAEVLYAQVPQMDQWLLLAGFVGMERELALLPDSLYQNRSAKQAYNLALVRSNNTSKLANLMRNVRRIPVEDDFVYQVAPLLLYTRQREAIDHLLDIVLQSPLNCHPADAETSGQISCAYRLIEMLAPVLEDYPYQLSVSGDLDTDDYPAALRQIQEWIRRHRDDYVIVQHKY